MDRRRLELWWQGGLFLGLFVYVWRGVQPQLLYHGFGVFAAYPVFSWEAPFLRTAFGAPGGPLNALAALLAQTYRSPWLGALVIIAVLVLLFVGVQRLLRAMRASWARDLAWVPVIVALMIYSRYDDPLAALLAILLSVWMAVLYESIPTKTLPARAGVFAVLFAMAYYLAGASAFVFAGVICLIEALLHRRIVVAVVAALLAAGVSFVLGRFIFGLGLREIFTIGTLWDSGRSLELVFLSRSLTLVLYAFVPVLILVTSCGQGLVVRERVSHRPWIVVRMLAVILLAALCLALSRNHLRDERSLHSYAQQRQWDRVIALAHRMRGKRAFTRSGVFDVNRALAHLGRSGDELCAYPQDETKTLFLSFDDMTGRFQHAKLLELYLDLGCPNAAEKNAYELLDNEGPSPHVLEALVRIHLAKVQRQSARIVFAALKKYAGGRAMARRWEDAIADPARADSDPLIGAWRRTQATTNHAVGGISFEPLLKRLLQDHPDHRLAFEYLMAHFLLTHQRAELVRCLPLLGPLGYTRLPRHWAEAVLVHALETKTTPDAQGWTIEPDVYNQFREITTVVRGAQGNNQAVFDRLAPKYGDTYTFYSLFNTCGAR
ncbi:MAG: hypothetical protein GXY19_09150 [Phycisphaerae bacterium]|nr:hypothetical protein [Phycisphaerae bacterium]